MKLDEYQIRQQNHIADNLYTCSMKLNDLRNQAALHSKAYYTHQLENLISCLGHVTENAKDLKAHSARKAKREAKNNAK